MIKCAFLFKVTNTDTEASSLCHYPAYASAIPKECLLEYTWGTPIDTLSCASFTDANAARTRIEDS